MNQKTFFSVINEALGEYSLTPVLAEAIKFLFMNKYESLGVVDSHGRVQFLDRMSEKLFNTGPGEAKGKYLNEVNPDEELTDVITSGTPQIGRIFNVKGKQRLVSRFPLIKDGKIIGAFGRVLLHSAEELERVRKESERLKLKVISAERKISQEHKATYFLKDILGKSPQIKHAINLARKMASTNTDVLIQGDSGTGKELFAHAIHNASKRHNRPFVKVNCPAIPVEMAESELFGYEKGAYTGALKEGKAGKFEIAQGGTIFLDEIGCLPMSIQAKLLRVIQEREVERLGGQKVIQLNFRLIAATNEDLQTLSQKGKFRSDFYYRLSKGNLHLPPLRERTEDIPIYTKNFLRILNRNVGTNVKQISKAASQALTKYPWPGNVRELINVLEQTLFHPEIGDQIDVLHLPYDIRQPDEISGPAALRKGTLREIMERVEMETIRDTLKTCGGNKRRTARELGIQRSALYVKLKKYKIN